MKTNITRLFILLFSWIILCCSKDDNNSENIDGRPSILSQYVLFGQEGGAKESLFRKMIATTDNNYIIVGRGQFFGGMDSWTNVTKINPNGEIIWSKRLDSNFIAPVDVVQTSDGGFLIGCIRGDIFYDKSFQIFKLDGEGNELWQKIISGDLSDRLSTVRESIDGGYIVGGFSNSNAAVDKTEENRGSLDFWILKLDIAGEIVWQKTIGGDSVDILIFFEQTPDGNYLLAGSSASDISGEKTEISRGGLDYWLLKIDQSGEILWQHTIGGNEDDRLAAVHIESNGDIILAGDSQSNISGEKTENTNGLEDFWIVKINSNGIIVWQNSIGGNDIEKLEALESTFDQGFLLAGQSFSDISGDKSEDAIASASLETDYWLVKLDENGVLMWDDTIGGTGNDVVGSVIQNTDGSYLIGGYSDSEVSGDKTLTGDPVLRHYWLLNYGDR